MIEIEFEKSPDTEIIGKYLSYKNNLIFGSSAEECSLIIDDQNVQSQHVELELSNDGLVCHNNNLGAFFHVNNKKVSGRKKLKAGDSVTIGTTSLKIINFLFTDLANKKTVQENYQKITETMPEVVAVLDNLEKELIRLQIQESKESQK